MSWFSRFVDFVRTPRDGGKKESPEAQLAEVERALKENPLAIQGLMLNRAGDLCRRIGDRERALEYFGRAIDSFLEDEQPEAARGVTKKIFRVRPEAIRTVCTLAWLDLADQQLTSAVRNVQSYAHASQAAGTEERAARNILEMAEIIPAEGFLAEAAVVLDQLGSNRLAEQVRGWSQVGGSEKALKDPRVLRKACLRLARRADAEQ
jgi:hypothetical protein